MEKAYDAKRNTFVGSFGGDGIDGSLLRLYEVGFIEGTDPRFIAAWQTVTFNEGRLPFLELLNTTKYPDGARLCYQPGTDERVDAST